MSPAHKNTVRPLMKRLQYMMGRNTPGTHNPDDTDVSRVLHTTDPSQVSGGIRSPGAEKSNDMRFKSCVAHGHLSLVRVYP